MIIEGAPRHGRVKADVLAKLRVIARAPRKGVTHAASRRSRILTQKWPVDGDRLPGLCTGSVVG